MAASASRATAAARGSASHVTTTPSGGSASASASVAYPVNVPISSTLRAPPSRTSSWSSAASTWPLSISGSRAATASGCSSQRRSAVARESAASCADSGLVMAAT